MLDGMGRDGTGRLNHLTIRAPQGGAKKSKTKKFKHDKNICKFSQRPPPPRIWFWQMNYPRSWSRRSCPIAAFRLEHYLNIDSPFSDTKYSKYCGKLNGNTTKPLYQLGQKSHNTFPDQHIFRIISFPLASWVPEPNNFLQKIKSWYLGFDILHSLIMLL